MATVNPIRRHRERCHETRELMSEYLDGELGGERAAVDRHLRRCPGCRRMLVNLGRVVSGLARLRHRPASG
jgi:predicted anti-sigma-YlaC factor YlaD